MIKQMWTHYQDIVKILRCMKGTLKHGLLLPSGKSIDVELIVYSNSNRCGDRVDRSITTKYLFKYLGAPISWCSKKPLVVVWSICEADQYIVNALSAC